jgi:hypothetical protein
LRRAPNVSSHGQAQKPQKSCSSSSKLTTGGQFTAVPQFSSHPLIHRATFCWNLRNAKWAPNLLLGFALYFSLCEACCWHPTLLIEGSCQFAARLTNGVLLSHLIQLQGGKGRLLSLVRLFESEWFDMTMAMHYLSREPSADCQEYLCQRMQVSPILLRGCVESAAAELASSYTLLFVPNLSAPVF